MKTLFSSVAVLSFSVSLFAAEEVKNSFPADNIKKIVVKNSSGDINVSGSAKDSVEVVAEKIRFAKNCKIILKEDGKTLNIEIEKPIFSFSDCEVRFHISALSNTELLLQTGTGDIDVAGIKSDIEFQTGSGDVTIDGAPTKLVGQTGSGDIYVEGNTPKADLKAGSGDINVEFTKAPEEGSLELVTGSGDIEVQLPKDSKVTTKFKSGSGSLKNEIGDSPKAKFSISARAGSGDLSVKKGQM